jgi:glycosyltransferase involved in cell wall biosynthesis
MKILLVSYFYLFKDSTGSLRAQAMAKYLPQNGIDVAVLTYCAQSSPISFADGVVGVTDITRETVHLPFFYVIRALQRSMRLLGIYRGLCEKWRDVALSNADEIIARTQPDAILASYPSVEALEISVALAEKYSLPLICDFRDGLMFEPLESKAQQHQSVREHHQKLEARVVAASKLIMTVSEPISDYFRLHYQYDNVLTLHNGFDSDDIAPDLSCALPAGVINIVHTGRLGFSRATTAGKGRGVDALMSALNLLLARAPELAKNLCVHFVGQLSTREKKCLGPLVEKGIVKLWGHQPRARALGFQRLANVLLLITAPDQTSIVTGKLFEYMATNKPILALTRGTEAARILRDTGTGLVVAPDKPNDIADALELLVRQNGILLLDRKNNAIAEFSRSRQITKFALRLQSIA